MIKFIENLPAKVVGIEVSGEVSKEDYETLIVPKMNQLAKQEGEINYLLVLKTDVTAFDTGVWWDDFKMALNHFNKWNKVAIVTDHKFITTTAHLFGFAFPGEHHTFRLNEYDQAVSWIKA